MSRYDRSDPKFIWDTLELERLHDLLIRREKLLRQVAELLRLEEAIEREARDVLARIDEQELAP